MMKALVACFCLAAIAVSPIASGQLPLPEGFRFPTDADRTHGWAALKKDAPGPFHARADFDGDGRDDEAWILLATEGPGWGLFVYVNSSSPIPSALLLDRNRGDARAQTMGVAVAPKGAYRTACGKGHRDCERGEPKTLRLKRPAIDYVQFEGAQSFFWWDAKTHQFRRTWMSDGPSGRPRVRR